MHTGAFRGQHFLLDTADRQHVPAQRDLAGHRGQWTNLLARQQ